MHAHAHKHTQYQNRNVEIILPELGQFTTCFILLLCVTTVREMVSLIIGKCLKKEVPPAMMFPMWEGPVFLTQFLGICDSMASILTSECIWNRIIMLILFWVSCPFRSFLHSYNCENILVSELSCTECTATADAQRNMDQSQEY